MRLLLPVLLAACLLAGCATPPKGATATTASPATAAPLLHTALRYDGTTSLFACASAAGTSQCANPPPALQPGNGGFHQLDYKGNGQWLHANVTWTATPALNTLHAVLLHKLANGSFTGGRAPTASGPSPLQLDFPLNGTASQWMLAIYDSLGRGAAGAGAGVYLPQSFHVEGDAVSH
jgi:hypothetical protein